VLAQKGDLVCWVDSCVGCVGDSGVRMDRGLKEIEGAFLKQVCILNARSISWSFLEIEDGLRVREWFIGYSSSLYVNKSRERARQLRILCLLLSRSEVWS